MTDNNHPMLPTQEQLTEWDSERFDEGENFDVMMIKAFQAGADQELEACCEAIKDLEWFEDPRIRLAELRATRRPKPPTLAEQGMEALRSTPCTEQRHYDALFAALNRLAELEDSNG